MVLIIYDTLLTFGDELDLIWRKKLNLGSFSYLLSRYSWISSVTVDVIFERFTLLMVSHKLVADLGILASITNVLAVIGVHTLLLGRAYAVSGGKYTVGVGLALILVLYAIITLVNTVLDAAAGFAPRPNRDIILGKSS